MTGWRGFDAGKNLKSSTAWNGLDLFGFSALPAGYRTQYGSNGMGDLTDWWTSDENDTNTALDRYLYSDQDEVYRLARDKQFGFSVRCVKN